MHNHTIGQICYAHILVKDQEHCTNYVAITEIAINSTFNASINKALFEFLFGENIPLLVDLLLSREFSINPHAYTFARKIKQLVKQVKSAIHDA